MSSTTKLKEQARRHEQKEEWERAIDTYQRVIEAGEEGHAEAELPLYNRIGDLYLRLGKPNDAVRYYEEAAAQYAEAALYNNAIALCNKALRYAPGKPSLLRKLGTYCNAQGFLTDARRWFLEYAELKFRAGDVDEAFGALEEFADTTDDPEIRELLAQRLETHERAQDAVRHLGIAYALRQRRGETEEADALRERIHALDPAADLDAFAAEAERLRPAAAAVTEEPEDYGGLEIETTAGAAGIAEGEAEGAADPADSETLPLLDEEAATASPDAYGMIEPTSAGAELDAEPEPLPGLESTSLAEDEPLPTLEEAEEVEPLPGLDEPAGVDALDAEAAVDEETPLPLLDEEETAAAGEPAAAAEDELPLMDLGYEEDLDSAVGGLDLGGFGLGDADATVVEPEPASAAEPERAPPPDVDAARERVARLLDEGKRAAAVTELERLHTALAAADDLEGAGRILDELLALDPDNQRALQHRVEYAFRLGDESQLLRAYLALAASLERGGAATKARAVYQRVLEIDAENERALRALRGPAPAAAAASPAATEYVDLASLVHDELPEATTRFVVAEEEPSGDEDQDFAEILTQFKAKVSEHLPVDDPAAHYDLGLAYKEMGLVDEAIAEFQIALRGGKEQLRIYEELGQCFMLKGQHNIAVKILTRAAQLPHADALDQIGVFYHLGRSYEELGQRGEAKDAYERVVGLDLAFRDAADRLARL